jgi:hypothetical protein
VGSKLIERVGDTLKLEKERAKQHDAELEDIKKVTENGNSTTEKENNLITISQTIIPSSSPLLAHTLHLARVLEGLGIRSDDDGG